ncbi:hypothetical protein AMTRI_Chr05g64340 [Amborella trichopoda]
MVLLYCVCCNLPDREKGAMGAPQSLGTAKQPTMGCNWGFEWLQLRKKRKIRAPDPKKMREFCYAMQDCSLTNSRNGGRSLTWDNHQVGPRRVEERLVRAMDDWRQLDEFPDTKIEVLDKNARITSPSSSLFQTMSTQAPYRFNFKQCGCNIQIANS